MYFPIFDSEQRMLNPRKGIDSKQWQWLSTSEKAIIKGLRPYKDGDDTIWPLHHLDITRKHHRLVGADVNVHNFRWERGGPGSLHGYHEVSGFGVVARLKDKIVLHR